MSDSEIYSGHRYWVEIEGMTEAFFTECSGLQVEIEVEEWREGGRNEYTHRLPGRAKLGVNLVLKRGIASDELWQWYFATASGQIKRRPLMIALKGYDDAPLLRWSVEGALPVKWSGPSFKSDTGAVAFETIELMHQGLKPMK